MMLSVRSIGASAASGLAQYYESLARVDDYYEGGKEPPGYWLGEGARALGLHDEVREGELLRALQGYSPASGEPLARNAGDEHKPGWDCTFSCPKSVSTAWAVADPELRTRIESAHREAVAYAVGYLEREAVATRHGFLGEQREPVLASGGIVAAAYGHSTSRAQDPQLHTHVIIANITPGDGRGIDLDTRHKTAAGALYRSELAHGLREIGFAIERDGSSFRIAGIPERLVEQWSSRRAEIEAALQAKGLSSARAAEVAALDTRQAKEQLPREELFTRWQGEAREHGFAAEQVREISRLGRDAPVPEMKPAVEISRDLTRESATFSRVQAIRAAAVEAQGVLSAREAEAFAARVMSGPEIVKLEASRDRSLEAEYLRHGERYTTREMLAIELAMLDRAERMSRHHTHPVSDAALSRAAESFPSLSDEQRRALAHITRDTGSIAVVQGHAGTGKNFTLGAAREVWATDGYRVIGTALSNAATRNLEQESGIASINTAKLAFEIEQGRLALDPHTVLVVDEAAMLGTRQLDELTARAEAAGAKIVLVGDTRQLQAIEAGAPMRAFAERVGQVELTEVRRQRDPMEREIARDFRAGRAIDALQKLDERGRLHVAPDTHRALAEAARGFLGDRGAGKSSLVVAATRAEVRNLNHEIRTELIACGEVARQGVPVRTSNGWREFSQGDQVIFGEKFHFGGRSDPDRSVWNGATGKVLDVHDAGSGAVLHVQLSHSDEIVRVDTSVLDKIDHGYATTTHKAQGATVDRCHVVAGERTGREWTYVAGSRHREEVHFYTSREHVPNQIRESALARDMSRTQQKDMATDYSRAEAYSTQDVSWNGKDSGPARESDSPKAEIGMQR
jgi:Ti-type conjugative transfer relaxase TraA